MDMRKTSLTSLALALILALATTLPAQAEVPGGRFILWNKDRQAVTDNDFRGKYLLVFFGYTFCPDICPTSLNMVSEAMDILGDKAEQVVPLFISVDPARDTVEHLRDYVEHFHPSMVGLTGTQEMIDRVAKSYKVTFVKVREEGAEEDNYTMDHTASIFLMGPDGKFRVKFLHGISSEDLAKRVAEFM